MKRACADEFPLDAFSRGGRPPEDSRDQKAESTVDGADADAQQRRNGADVAPMETWGSDDDAGQPSADTATLLSELTGADAASESGDGLQQEVNAAIETLEALRGELE